MEKTGGEEEDRFETDTTATSTPTTAVFTADNVITRRVSATNGGQWKDTDILWRMLHVYDANSDLPINRDEKRR